VREVKEHMMHGELTLLAATHDPLSRGQRAVRYTVCELACAGGRLADRMGCVR
jgi:hypothetical protein